MLELGDLDEDWMLDLWEAAPTPEKAARSSKAAITRVLKKHRIRRFDAAHVLSLVNAHKESCDECLSTANNIRIEAGIAPDNSIETELKEQNDFL